MVLLQFRISDSFLREWKGICLQRPQLVLSALKSKRALKLRVLYRAREGLLRSFGGILYRWLLGCMLPRPMGPNGHTKV